MAAIALFVAPVASGCYQNLDNTVSVMGPTGNGVQMEVGRLSVKNLTLVAGPEGRVASVVFTAVNNGEQADAITGVTVAGTRATIRTAPLRVPPGGTVEVGGDSPNQVVVTGLTVPKGSYADVAMSFRDAGSVTQEVLVVPAEGYYADYGPGANVIDNAKEAVKDAAAEAAASKS